MSNLLDIEHFSEPIGKNARYGTEEELRELILFKRIVEWTSNYLKLDDGTYLNIGVSDFDCCAYADGEFLSATLDAVITDFEVVKLDNDDEDDDYEMTTNKVSIKIYHNQNPIALAECSANNGNGGYYYSLASLIIDNIHFPVVDA